MTKLLEWLGAFAVIAAVWLALLTNKIETNIAKQYPNLTLYFPVILIAFFGVYSLSVVLYRVFTFNNCEAAAAELQQEIKEAKTELAKLGFQFKTK